MLVSLYEVSHWGAESDAASSGSATKLTAPVRLDGFRQLAVRSAIHRASIALEALHYNCSLILNTESNW